MAGSVLAAQLYTVREFTKTPGDIAATMKKVRAIGYEVVQCSALGAMPPEELRKICDGEGLTICATHESFERMQSEPQAVIDEHEILGCAHTAIGGLPGDYRNPEGFARFAREATEVARRLKQGGLTFSYHNHSFEFVRLPDGRTALETLYEDSDPELFLSELDTYWVQHGGGDPAAWIRKMKGRAILLHLKDMVYRDKGPTFAEIGAGNLNWPSILAAATEADVRWYIVEQDTCPGDPFDSLKISFENLKQMGLS